MTVRFYARLRELAGRDEWVCESHDDVVVADIWRASIQAYPPLASMSGSVACALNAEFARTNTRVHDGDEIAFLPPVSGGARSPQ